jgi:hypothetical protein
VSFLLAAIVAATLTATNPLAETFGEGETLDYNLTWLRITGGTARMTISPMNGEPALLRITSVAKSSSRFSRIFRVHDQIESVVARGDFSTVKYTKNLDEGGDKATETTTIEEGVATRMRRKVRKFDVPRPVFDPISVIYYLRMLDLSPGKMHEMTLVADGKLYTVRARVTRRETLETPAGKFETVLVEPIMEHNGVVRKERLFIWYSDDERRLPVRIRTEVNFGAITATLRGSASGVRSTDPPVLNQ